MFSHVGGPRLGRYPRRRDPDVLLADTAADMAARGPKAEVVTVPGCGHAPALLDDDQTGTVADFLAPG